MIARQRQNLNRTFALRDSNRVDDETARRLSQTERELLDATREFTEGIEARGGPIPSLHEAQIGMEWAAAALQDKQMPDAVNFEQLALQGLIAARKNIRQMLSQSQSASECRKFDRQQRQRLRKPPQENQADQFAKLQQEVEKLAETEKKFSEELESKQTGGAQLERSPDEQAQSPKRSSGSSGGAGQSQSSKTESRQSPAEQQAEAAAKAAELSGLMKHDPDLSDLARERMDQAKSLIEESADSLAQGREQESGEQAAQAAAELDRLADQIAALKAAEIAEKLAQARDLAEQLAQRQQSAAEKMDSSPGGENAGSESGAPSAAESQKSLAAGQRSSAEDAKTLDDLLKRFQVDAADEDRRTAQALAQAAQANSPAEAAERLDDSADKLESGEGKAAAEQAGEAAKLLASLAGDLARTHRGLVHAQLDALLAAERQTAEAQQALESVTSESQQAQAEQMLQELRDTLESLNAGQIVKNASDELTEAIENPGGGWGGINPQPRDEQGDPTLIYPPERYPPAVAGVIQTLQEEIQKTILSDALLDRDGAVPPQYKPLVEKYLEVLSNDLR